MICVSLFGSFTKKEALKKLETNKELGGYSEENLSAFKLIVSFA